ncbi:MAG: hypothetical protein JNL60_17075 [Bacteroidia bacterium]|nr:hypothetical protein [Bacteroidia bacterium]
MIYAEEISLIIQQRIAGFFNQVSSVEEIMSTIIDDPCYGKDKRGINKKLAEKILHERRKYSFNKFRNLEQILAIKGIGYDTRHDIFFNFAEDFSNPLEKLTYATQIEKRIVKYINSIGSAASLVKKVVDDPAYGGEGKGLSLKQAEAVLKARDKKNTGKFLSIQEIFEVKGMGKDACHDLIFSFWLEDVVPPPISIQSPSDGFCTNKTSVDLSVSCYAPSEDSENPDGGNISKIEVLRDGKIILTHESPPSQTFFVLRFLNLDISDILNTGTETVFQVRAYKKSQKQGILASSEKISVYCDDMPPSIEFVSPEQEGYTNQAKPNIYFTVRDLGGSGVKPEAIVTINGKSMNVKSEVYIGNEVNFTAVPKSNLTEGPQILKVTASDWAGNQYSRELNFNVDLTNPRVISSQPANGNFYTEVKNISASILETGGPGLKPGTLSVTLDQKTIKATCKGPVDGLYSIEAGIPSALTEGIHKLSISINDVAGNTLDGGEITFGILKSKEYFEAGYNWLYAGETKLAENVLVYSGDQRSAFLLAQLFQNQDRQAEAIKAYKTANTPEAKACLAEIYMKTKNTTELMPILDEFIAEHKNTDAMCFKGNLLAQSGDMKKAEELWKDSDTPRSWYNLACLECSRSNKEEAIANITKLAAAGGAWLETLFKDPNLALIKADLANIPKIIK